METVSLHFWLLRVRFVTSRDCLAANHMDLLGGDLHELGHLLRHDHDEESIIGKKLAAVVRRTELERNDVALTNLVFGLAGGPRAVAWLEAWLNEQCDSTHGRAKRGR